MAGKNLYEILEVARNATPETVEAAYRLQCDRIKKLAMHSPDLAAAQRLAADEAFKTLSDPPLRGRYDLKLRGEEPVITTMEVAEPSWLARNWTWATMLLVLVVAAGHFYDSSRTQKREKLEMQRQLAEKEAALEREQAARASEDAARQQAAAEQKARQERDREYAWSQQVRAQASMNAVHQDRIAQQQTQQALREKQTQERQAEAQRLRMENEARMNLEREKQKLRMLECQRGAC